MAAENLESRVTALEKELENLKKTLASSNGKKQSWWKEIEGAFAGDAAYKKAMKLGRQYRESTRPKAQKTKTAK